MCSWVYISGVGFKGSKNGIRPTGKSTDNLLCRNVGCDLANPHPIEDHDDDERHLDLMEAKSSFGLPTQALIPKIPVSRLSDVILATEKEEPPPPIPILNQKSKNIYNETKDELKPERSLLITTQ